MAAETTFVIVGGGLAGAKAAETLRAEGFAGRVVLIGDEDQRPYDRPPLTKEYLRGEIEREKLDVHPAAFYAEQAIELRPGRVAVGLDPASREVALDDGERFAYDRLLIATGAEPRRLPVAGADLDCVLTLRTVADCDALRAEVEQASSVVVVGAGWIGAEVAASARQLGRDVTLIDPAAVPLERVLGREIGGLYRDLHAGHGVRMLMGVGVSACEGDGRVERVRIADGRVIDADLVIVGIGVEPHTGLAARAGLAVGDGILVDEHLETSVGGVFAAGDVAGAHHPFYGERLRVEHWANALHQGPVAARAMLGTGAVHDRLPYFFSDQFDVGMEYSGLARAGDRLVLRGDPATRELIAFWLRGEHVVAGVNINVWDVTDAIGRLIRGRVAVEDTRLADPDVPLDALAPAPA